MVKRKSNWYTKYLDELPESRVLYKRNLARFIRCMMNSGAMACEIFTCGYENNLIGHVELHFDARIAKGVSLLEEKYPLYMDWLKALQDWNVLVTKKEFDEALMYPVEDKETFLRVFGMWEYVLKDMTRYIMQHEAIYGKKEMWNKKIYY